MTHRDIQDQLFAFYDGELVDSARRAVEAHLLDCVDCRRVVAQWTRVAGAAFHASAVSPSEAFVQRVMRRIAAPPPHPFPWRHWFLKGGWLLPTLGLAATLLVMVNGPLPSAVSLDSLLLWDGHESAAMQQVLTGERPSADDILGLLMEETL